MLRIETCRRVISLFSEELSYCMLSRQMMHAFS